MLKFSREKGTILLALTPKTTYITPYCFVSRFCLLFSITSILKAGNIYIA